MGTILDRIRRKTPLDQLKEIGVKSGLLTENALYQDQIDLVLTVLKSDLRKIENILKTTDKVNLIFRDPIIGNGEYLQIDFSRDNR